MLLNLFESLKRRVNLCLEQNGGHFGHFSYLILNNCSEFLFTVNLYFHNRKYHFVASLLMLRQIPNCQINQQNKSIRLQCCKQPNNVLQLLNVLKAHECHKEPILHTNALNTTFFCWTSPLKAPNRLKSLKLA
jgi:hypothetical protein